MGLIRILLAMAVCAGHSSIIDLPLLSGQLAVKSFFILSGFYMTLVLSTTYRDKPAGLFWSNRLLRIMPCYLLIMFLSFVCLWLWDIHPYISHARVQRFIAASPETAGVVGLINLFILGQDMLFCFGIDQATLSLVWAPARMGMPHGFSLILVPQAWSMSLELIFYLLSPFILNRSTRILILLAASSFFLRLITGLLDPELSFVSERVFPTTLFYFLSGALSYRYYEKIRLTGISVTAGAFLLAAVLCFILFMETITLTGREILYLVLLSAALPFVFNLTRNHPLDRFLAEISYPFYLTHFLVLTIFETYFIHHSPVLMLVLVFCAAVTLYLSVDLPLSKIRRNRVDALLVIKGVDTGRPLAEPASVTVEKR